jgi:hypothetical protein
MMKIRFLENSGILQPQQISVGLYCRWNPSSRSKTESTVATEALSALLAHAWEVGFISNVRRS